MNEELNVIDRKGKIVSAGVVGGCLLGCVIAIVLTCTTVVGYAQRPAVALEGPVTATEVVDGGTAMDGEPEAEPEAGLLAQGEVEVDKTTGARTYTVIAGDTLSGVSAKTGVSVDHLAKANKIENVHVIYAGSVLVIPEVIAKI